MTGKADEVLVPAVHANLAEALAAFQAEVPTVVKGAEAKVQTKTGKDYTYKYADLAVITPLVLPLLGRHGLAWSTQPTLMGDSFVLHYSLKHAGGEEIEGIYPLPDPHTPPQELGSAITYARRYALCAVTGVAPGGDDDDAASAPAAPDRRRARAARPSDTPQPQVAGRDWAQLVLEARTIDELRAVHGEAEKAAELAAVLDPKYAHSLEAVTKFYELPNPPASVTVGSLIGIVKPAVAAREKALAERPAVDEGPEQGAGWPTAKPGDGAPEGLI